jgi:hypothetical protein
VQQHLRRCPITPAQQGGADLGGVEGGAERVEEHQKRRTGGDWSAAPVAVHDDGSPPLGAAGLPNDHSWDMVQHELPLPRPGQVEQPAGHDPEGCADVLRLRVFRGDAPPNPAPV